MIAHVVVLKRLPAKLSKLEYIIPDSLEASLSPGQLVRIPFKTSQQYGVVFAIEEKEIKEYH